MFTIISLVILTVYPSFARAPNQENIDSLIIISGNTIQGISPQVIAKFDTLGSFYYENDIYPLIDQYPAWNANLITRIAFCESGFNNRAVGDHGTPYRSYGLLQIRNLPSRTYTIEELFDPERNIEIAYEIWQNEWYWAWANCYKQVR